jgi:glutamine amidotransferase
MVTIVDYRAGNLRSVQRACQALKIECVLTGDADAVARADRIIFPGVGNARSAMDTLNRTGLGQAMTQAFRRGVPVLGICLGAQIVLDRSEEGQVACLGLVRGATRRFRTDDPAIKIPHMGWNEVQVERPHPLLAGMERGDEFYFVHSFYPDPEEEASVLATAHHGSRFCCALGRDNLFATQFHPEKSGRLGLELLGRFAAWKGTAC